MTDMKLGKVRNQDLIDLEILVKNKTKTSIEIDFSSESIPYTNITFYPLKKIELSPEEQTSVIASFRVEKPTDEDLTPLRIIAKTSQEKATLFLWYFFFPKSSEIVINLDTSDAKIDGENYYVGESYNANGRVYVPSTIVFDYLGFERHYDVKTKCMTITLEATGDSLEFISGEKEVVVNGKPVPVEKLEMIRDMRMHYPIRFIGELIGYSISWDGTKKTVTLIWKKEEK